MVREIRLFGDPILRTVCDRITTISESVETLIKDLEKTTSLPGRAGVAANQIGVGLRAFSFMVEGKVGHLINPEIIERTGEPVEMDEGCLSLPGLWSKTLRYEKVVVRGLLVSGEQVEISAEGLLAQVLQHEIDHLDGKVYLDRLSPPLRKKAMAELRQTSWFI